MCIECSNLHNDGLVRAGEEYKQLIFRLRDLVENHTLSLIQGQETWPIVAYGAKGGLPDSEEYLFECRTCHSIFELGINFFHGGYVSWELKSDKVM